SQLLKLLQLALAVGWSPEAQNLHINTTLPTRQSKIGDDNARVSLARASGQQQRLRLTLQTPAIGSLSAFQRGKRLSKSLLNPAIVHARVLRHAARRALLLRSRQQSQQIGIHAKAIRLLKKMHIGLSLAQRPAQRYTGLPPAPALVRRHAIAKQQ